MDDLKSYPCPDFFEGGCGNTEETCVWSHDPKIWEATLGNDPQQNPTDEPLLQKEEEDIPQEAENDMCAVCGKEFMESKIELLFPCGHTVHERCCGQWAVQCPAPRCFMSLIDHKLGEVEANHPLVWEAVVAFTKAAIKSERHELILTPFPEICEWDGKLVLGAHAKNLELLREIVKEVPPIKEVIKLSTQVSPRVSSFLNWTINSNRSAIMRIAKPIPFMESAHQFIFIQSTQKHARAFEELKRTRRSLWAFHGSKPENWHSIIRNGLVNASKTSLMTTGAVYGNGIYLSPQAAIAYHYSGMKGTPNPKAIKEEDGIPHDSFSCITICEVLDEGLQRPENKTGQIWVQPNESCVMTRFLFVFNSANIGGQSAVLTDPQYANQLDAAVRENWS